MSMFRAKRTERNKRDTDSNIFMSGTQKAQYKPAPEPIEKPKEETWMKRALGKVIKPIAAIALGFAMSLTLGNLVYAQEAPLGYQWEKRYSVDTGPGGVLDSTRIILFKISLAGDTIPCYLGADTTQWQFDTLRDVSGNKYYVNKQDTVGLGAEIGGGFMMLRWTGEKGTQEDLRAKYSGRRKDVASFYGDTTATKWVKVEQQEYDYTWAPIGSPVIDFVQLGYEPYYELAIYYRGRAPPYDETYIDYALTPPPFYLPYSEIVLSVSERAKLPSRMQLHVYPTPTNGPVNIVMGEGVESGSVKIYDMKGQRITDVSVSGGAGRGIQIDVTAAGLKSGEYLIKFDGVDEEGKPVIAGGKFSVVK